MITFFRYTYYGFLSFFQKKGKDIDKINAMVYTGSSRIIIYISILLILQYNGIILIDKMNKYIVLICYAIFESILSYFICGSNKHDFIESSFKKLSYKKQILFERLGVFLTPASMIGAFFLMLLFIRG